MKKKYIHVVIGTDLETLWIITRRLNMKFEAEDNVNDLSFFKASSSSVLFEGEEKCLYDR